jgi:hypothetical protein|tara:strand:- start:1000 stop:1758 length:759 start_codon:yes stop_codon:yes gene_type:complete
MITFCTTFAERIWHSKGQTVIKSVQEHYPEVKFLGYHENSVEDKKVDFSDTWDNFVPIDLFEVDNTLSDFLKESPFSKSLSMIGDDALNYYNRSAYYWFRKVATVNDAVDRCETPILIFLDTDTEVLERLTPEIIDYLFSVDFATIKRRRGCTDICHYQGSGVVDSGIMSFNLDRNGANVAKYWYDYYKNGGAFEEVIWADHYILTSIIKHLEHKLIIGGLDAEWGAPFRHINDYIAHHRGTQYLDRDYQND